MKHYQAEFGGGLGDIILNCYSHRRYMTLCNLPPDESATVFIHSVNPFAHELFTCCPSRDRLQVVTTGWFWDPDPKIMEDMRVLRGMPIKNRSLELPESRDRPLWYPSLADELVIKDVLNLHTPFLIIEPSAGDSFRTMPSGFLEKITAAVMECGHMPVLVGRNYEREGRRVYTDDRVVDLVDQLSVPGVLELLRLSRGTICTHSFIHHAACKDMKPNFVLYPQEMETLPAYGYQKRIKAEREGDQGHWWGVNQACTMSGHFQAFDTKKLAAWIESL